MHEPTLHIDNTLRRGDGGEFVTRVQEWLCFHQFNVGIDGDFGLATEQGVIDFQTANGVPATGEVDPSTFAMLTRSMAAALRPLAAAATLGQTIVACALQHLLVHPVEIGGQNRGPWVRLYLRGEERPKDPKLPQGADAWCAGFATTIIDQAASSMATPPPLGYHTNCNLLANAAKKEKRFRRGEEIKPAEIPPGSLMLIRKRGQRDRWHHTGVVAQALPHVVRTIEGNSANSTDENPSGHEVCRQLRPYGSLDFIVVE
jgi:Putative peptidoglycan binding domain